VLQKNCEEVKSFALLFYCYNNWSMFFTFFSIIFGCSNFKLIYFNRDTILTFRNSLNRNRLFLLFLNLRFYYSCKNIKPGNTTLGKNSPFCNIQLSSATISALNACAHVDTILWFSCRNRKFQVSLIFITCRCL
jgi:hypothetical protein